MSIQRRRSVIVGCSLTLVAALLGCPPVQPPPDGGDGDGNEPGGAVPFHQTVFTKILPAGYEGPASCQVCHLNPAQDLVQTGHWKWEGVSTNIVDQPAGTNGAKNLINSFLIGVPSNEPRCSQCHPSYGWTDKSVDFTSTAIIGGQRFYIDTGRFSGSCTLAGHGVTHVNFTYER
jgi:hypothetical protein